MPDLLPSGPWRGRYRDGYGTRHSTTFDTKREAVLFEEGQRVAVRAGNHIALSAGRTLLDDWTEKYFALEVHLRGGTRKTDRAYYRNHISPVLGARRIGSIRPYEVEQWIAALQQPGERVSGDQSLAPGTASRIYQIFHKIMAGAVDAEMIGRNPCPGRPRLSQQKQKPVRFLTAAEVEHLADHLPLRYQAAIYTMAYTGVRIGELAALRLDDFDLFKKSLHVDEGLAEVNGLTFDEPKTRRGLRHIPVADRLLTALESHIAEYVELGNSNAFLFPGPRGGALRPRLAKQVLETSGDRLRTRTIDTARLAPHRCELLHCRRRQSMDRRDHGPR